MTYLAVSTWTPSFVLQCEILTLLGGVQLCTQTNGVKPKMREYKLRTGVNCQGVLKEKGVIQMDVQEGLVVHNLVN